MPVWTGFSFLKIRKYSEAFDCITDFRVVHVYVRIILPTKGATNNVLRSAYGTTHSSGEYSCIVLRWLWVQTLVQITNVLIYHVPHCAKEMKIYFFFISCKFTIYSTN
jgi:hypothetical protein